jgi:dienelactone hydrolase
MMKSLLPILLLALFGCASAPKQTRATGPWNLPALKTVPAATWGAKTGVVQQVWYEGEPFQGKPTRIFAYLGRPENGTGPFPAMVLVHGGGGKAFKDWATHWAQRGYMALAMDLSGNSPEGRLPDGGPDQSDQTKFRNFTDAGTKDMWTYHAVAAVIRGHSLLAALPEVDPRRIGITGISWGGYLTCIVAGLDDRLKVAVPVYGCGFLHENSVWKDKSLAAMNPEARERWIKYFDPSQYLGGVDCPILFLNGSNDFAYPMDSYRQSYQLVRPHLRTVSVIVRLKHGHYWEFGEVDAFVDSVLAGGKPLARLQPMQITGPTGTARVDSPIALKKAELHYTSDTGEWQKREWKTASAGLTAGKISARLPSERPLVCYLSVTDERGVRVSTAHVELPAAK